MSRCTTAILLVSTCDITRLTNDVFPIRRGEMRITFNPFSKFNFSRRVSRTRSVKLLPPTETPYKKEGFLSLFIIVIRYFFRSPLGGPLLSELLKSLQRYNIFLIYTRPWSRKMHFFIQFREQGRATAHDFVVAHLAKKQYLCTVFQKKESQ